MYAANLHRQLRVKQDLLTLLNRELKHRIKNLFALTSSVAQQTVKGNLPRNELASAIAGRIRAIAVAQDLLDPADHVGGSDLRSLVDAVVTPLAPDKTQLEIDGPPVFLSREVTVAFGMVLYELGTNATKHGAWAAENGTVSIHWNSLPVRQLELVWKESGGAKVLSAANNDGFGTTVIKRALPQATVMYEIRPDGAYCQIRLPI
jgi:two-component sensor histidine kinase